MTSPEEILREYYGYNSFREGQRPLIERLMQGGDVLGIMPTGAGKSVCYQVPAMLLPGITVVVSPLISLMQDQVAALRQNGMPAVCLHSNLDSEDYFAALDSIRRGEVKLLYAAPERLLSESFFALTQQVQVSLVAVDEAHCLSQWGQDFRPHYLRIADFLRQLPYRPAVGAFTATATDTVRQDIIRLLGLNAPLEVVTGFDRPNLRWSVEQPKNKYTALKSILKRFPNQSGIVYCVSRKKTEEVCEKLCADGIRAACYHAGLPAETRTANQEAFLHDEVQIITATNAFGMGIDKSNVRFVVHYNMPKSMEAYYQEAGRAGRDGEPAECILLYSGGDVSIIEFMIDKSEGNELLTPEQCELVKQQDRERLYAMQRYCKTTDCLRHYILHYFGEKAPVRCENCGNCLAETEQIDATVQSQKILSCIYRTSQRGLNVSARLLCDIMVGEENERITKLRCNTLSTYGLLRDEPRGRLEQMVDVLIARGYLRVGKEYAALSLDPALARPVLIGAETVTMSLPKPKPRVKVTLATVPEGDESLFAHLRRLRKQIAEREYVPAYAVFSDATLRLMCERRPQTPEELLDISGVGKHKLEKYGKAFLEAIAAH